MDQAAIIGAVKLIGAIARLQIQTGPLKVEGAPRRRYDPGPLLAVDELMLRAEGVSAGSHMLDVHHRDHPQSRNQQVNGVSIGFTSHYQRMRERFGAHLADGVAGENILVDTTRAFAASDLSSRLSVQTREGRSLTLSGVMVAEPCVEFTRFALRLPADTPSDRAVAEALQSLRAGVRGYYASVDGDGGTLRPGDLVFEGD